MRNLDEQDFYGKVALVRVDFNVPLSDGKVADDARIRASLPSLRKIIADGGGCVVMSHLGRPQEGAFTASLSLAPVATRLAELLGMQVQLQSLEEAQRPKAGEILLLENTRFNTGEKGNAIALAKSYAKLGDVFVMDAFASSHRAEASTVALAKVAATCCAGKLLLAEIEALHKALKKPARPLLVILGGAKISTKLTVFDNLASLADNVIVGGGIANTFLAAKGLAVGTSLVETSMVDLCGQLLKRHGDKIHLPTDVVVAISPTASGHAVRQCSDTQANEMILDVGPDSLASFSTMVAKAATIIWNGALGVFEQEAFSAGTRSLACAIAEADAFSLAGGGETVAAANLYQVADQIDCLSTGGGAFLEFVEGKELPGLKALQ